MGFGKLAAQAKDFIEENPEQVGAMQEQAMGFLKTAVDAEADSSGPTKTGDEKIDKFNEYKHQAAVMLKPQIDGIAGGEEEQQQAASSSSSGGGKPSYLQAKPEE